MAQASFAILRCSFAMHFSPLTTASIALLFAIGTAAQETCAVNSSPAKGAICDSYGVLSGDVDTVVGDSRDAEYQTPEGCAALCANTAECESFILDGSGDSTVCLLFSTTLAQQDWATSSQYYYGWDQSCFTCTQPQSCPTGIVCDQPYLLSEGSCVVDPNSDTDLELELAIWYDRRYPDCIRLSLTKPAPVRQPPYFLQSSTLVLTMSPPLLLRS